MFSSKQIAALAQLYGTPPSKFLKLPDGTIAHYRDYVPADGPPRATLVLLHGANLSLFWWEPLAALLRTSMRVVTVDFPGHGLTEAKDRAAPFTKFVDMFTQTLGVSERFVLIGHSMGGQVAWRFALNHPERLTGLILIAPSGTCDPGGPQGRVMRLVRSRWGTLLFKLLYSRRATAASTKTIVFDPSLIAPATVDRDWALSQVQGTRDLMIARLRAPTFDPKMVARLKDITLPTLLLWGRNDIVFPLAHADQFTQAISSAKLFVYDACGHWPMAEQAARAAEDIMAFVSGLSVDNRS
jgi:pimeloyl-ACP methyl ester carboxylesterase